MNFTKHLTIILKEMCTKVGADFEQINFKKENWFSDYEWTEKQENDFKEWLIKYLTDNKEARQEFMKFPSNNKKSISKTTDEFIFAYGWKTKK